ncbi:hypothetical protein LJC64_02590, partial [Ruminococcaceae bacterium OttesenSCG-928-A11]|nr:hypothetical protein [Ruminococcaceae bacterium OttesenSCG-928-A11]
KVPSGLSQPERFFSCQWQVPVFAGNVSLYLPCLLVPSQHKMAGAQPSPDKQGRAILAHSIGEKVPHVAEI